MRSNTDVHIKERRIEIYEAEKNRLGRVVYLSEDAIIALKAWLGERDTWKATYASRNGVPLEVVSKVILRHQDLKTTQVYLGKINDSEAIRWLDILHGK
jgi:integrase